MSLLSISTGENQLILFKPRLSVVDENDNEIDDEHVDGLSVNNATDRSNCLSVNNNRVSFKMPPTDATSSPLLGTRSPFNDVFALITQGNEKALKQAFYNTIAVVFILFVLASVAAVYLVLQPFLQPLLWATLIGSVLHPFKRKLTRFLRWWISDSQKRPLSFSVIKMPLTLVNYSVNSIVSIIHQYYKLLLFIFVALLSIHLALFYFTITTRLISFSQSLVYSLSDALVLIVDSFSPIILATLVVGFLILNCITPPSIAAKMINIVFPITSILLALKILQMMGTLGLMIMFILSSITLAGFLSSFFGISDSSGDETDSSLNTKTIALVPFLWSFMMSLMPSSGESSSSPLLEQEPENDSPDGMICREGHKEASAITPLNPPSKKSSSLGSHFERRQSHVNCFNTSTTYIYAVFWSCLLAQLWLRPHILYLIPVIAALFMLTKFWKMLNGKEVINRWASIVMNHLTSRMTPSHHAIIQRIKYYYMIGDDTMANLLLKSLDSLCSALSIFILTILVLFAVVFLSIQVYQESVHLVELTGSMMNSTLAYSPQLAKAFPVGFLGNTNLVDEMIANAYVYGRQWLQKSIRTALNVGAEANNNASRSVEKQLLEVWDRVYHQWLIRNTNSTSYEINNRSFEAYNWNRLFAALQTLDFALCFNLLKENLDTVFSIFDSVWILLKSNLTLLFTLITAALSLILSGSSAILNWCLNLIIFATSLFYLLCSSGDEYKPVELAARFLPDSDRKSNYLNKFGQAVEESVNSVFAASFKMTVFYGLYTWLIHTLFEVKIIYIPSVLAALFGAVPFIGAYWASVPAVLELYLVHNLGGRALLMVFFALLPSYFVDSEIYSDIKGGGHPYLTGLAIAGGIFYLGFSGAFLGPMILACLFVAGKLYTSIMAESSVTKDTGFNLRSLRPHLKRMNTTTDL